MQCNTLIIGAGAAGMMCAAHAGAGVVVIDHAKAPGEKIRISGGGRCNFTNLYCDAHAFLSTNPHFAKSALARYTQWDFIDLVDRHHIAWHEKTLGQLFCDGSAREIVAMLRSLMDAAGATLLLNTGVSSLVHGPDGFEVVLSNGQHLRPRRVVVASGGKSIPKMGASDLAYDIARQFNLPVTETRPALVPFTFSDKRFAPIAGVSAPARVHAGGDAFDEAILFTHRGLSGPAMLQASSYWREGSEVVINLDPAGGIEDWLKEQRHVQGKKQLATVLSERLPARLVGHLSDTFDLGGRMGDLSDKRLSGTVSALTNWSVVPQGTEGYRTAEVTLGGVSTDALSAQTMEAKTTRGLYFIGECVDVTGWLGGYNFQWAWASAMACARAIAADDT